MPIFKFIDDENNSINQSVTSDTTDLKFDFNSGEFVTVDGRIQTVDKTNRVKQWIEKALKTEAYINRLYRYSHYGLYTEKIIGYVYDREYIDALIKQEIDYLMKLSDDIAGTRDIEIINEGDVLQIKFTVILLDEEEIEYEGEVKLQ